MRLIALAAFAGLLTTAAQGDESTVSYNLAPGTCSKPIAIPANNRAVILAGTSIEIGNGGTGMVSLLRLNRPGGNVIIWAGTDYPLGTERGESTAAGTLIMYLDSAGYVQVLTAGSTHIQVCSSSLNSQNGNGYLTFTY